VKNPADETRQYTEQITENIDELQAQTGSTVDAAERSHQQTGTASDQISDVLIPSAEVVTAIDQTDAIAELESRVRTLCDGHRPTSFSALTAARAPTVRSAAAEAVI